ncbi:flagellar hook-basal body protein [Sporosarcina sp. HYO08]|uniref:flagellar hook-basal body protein n=1 Tax=Sporosarcina sp. HYO08 TaxID=1759557 RepID=UPI00079B4B68|nr:flagellar hook-basal body protein [Sporosarcina sp. HYO08]KXH83995.1 flagellar hook-basal body protein [Sporosarcina sp. HYO08]
MIRTMTTATNTLGQLQHQIDLIGNNLANVSTHGYKASEAKFHELLYQQFQNDKTDEAPRQSPLGIRYGSGAMLGQAQVNWKVGGLQSTGRPLDFAFTAPKQYFNVIMPMDGGTRTVYTRQGNFYMSPIADNQVMLVNGDGYPVADQSGNPITFSDHVQSYTVKSNGILQLTHQNGSMEEITLGITTIERPNLMEHISSTYIGFPNNFAQLGIREEEVAINLQGEQRQMIGLENGALEGSNVNVQKEMTDLIGVQRSYQLNARTITLADQMLGLINNIR